MYLCHYGKSLCGGYMDNSLNQLTYDRFKKDILTFILKPGDTVSAAKVAERYNVSRTPAREALVKLETEGLVDIIPQSKSVISRIDLQRAEQEWFVRKSLELAMVDSFFDKVTKADIKEMEKYNNAMIKCAREPRNHDSSYRYLMADNAFHGVTYRVAGELLAASVISNTMAHYSRLRFLTELDGFYQDRTVSGHEELINLVKAGDREGYRKALQIHLGHIMNDVEEMEKKFPNFFTL